MLLSSKNEANQTTMRNLTTIISFWFCGLLICHDISWDWMIHDQHSCNISDAHGFLSLTDFSILTLWNAMLHNICICINFKLVPTYWVWDAWNLKNVKYVFLLLHNVIVGVKWFTTALTVRIQVQRHAITFLLALWTSQCN